MSTHVLARHATHLVVAVFIFATLAACTSREAYDRRVQTWVGSPIEEVVDSWGLPTGQFGYDDGSWDFEWTRRWWAETLGNTYYEQYCTTAFHTGPDRVVDSVEFRGTCRSH